MTRLVIIGGGGHGAVVAEAAAESGRWPEIVFLEDDASEAQVLNFPIVGTLSELSSFLDGKSEALIAIGNNTRRLELINEISRCNGVIATVIHPSAIISRSASISAGTVICAGAIVNARASIEVGCILNTASTVDHDCSIEAGAHISPGANLAGNVHVGERAWVGIGASVKEGVRIGQDSIVAAGAAVISDVDDGVSVGGVPARVLTKKMQ